MGGFYQIIFLLFLCLFSYKLTHLTLSLKAFFFIQYILITAPPTKTPHRSFSPPIQLCAFFLISYITKRQTNLNPRPDTLNLIEKKVVNSLDFFSKFPPQEFNLCLACITHSLFVFKKLLFM